VKLALWAAVLTLANVLADVAIGSPLMVLPQLLEHFGTDQAAWLGSSAMLAAAIWSPLLAKCSDLYGKRRVLVTALLIACAGAVICLIAPNLWIFLVGRFFQGAALATIFLSVALVLQICSPRAAMGVVGVVTSSSSAVGIVEPFLMQPVIGGLGFRGVFLVAAGLAAVAALAVRCVVPESPIRSPGRVDVVGALLLGGGLAAVLAWLSGGAVALLAGGVAALSCWLFLARRVDEPLVDIRALRRPVLLTLLAVVLAAGAFRSMLQLTSIVAQVSADLDVGYGFGGGNAVAVLLAAPNLGIMIGGACAGWVAGRLGPALPLLAGVILGATATFAMLAGVSILPMAVVCGAATGVAAGAIGTSGYTVATGLEPPQRQGTVAGLVSVSMALGSVVFTFAGNEILKATRIPGDAVISTGTGVALYIAMAGALFLLAALPAVALFSAVRTSR
jgi:MFS family permease